MLISMKGQIPDFKYFHDPELRNNQNHTVCYQLFNQGLIIPEQWQDRHYKHPKKDINGYTKAMKQIINEKIIPSKMNYHNPLIQNKIGFTVAMLLTQNQQIIDDIRENLIKQQTQYNEIDYFQMIKQWLYDKSYIFSDGNTSAMIFAKNGIIPNQYWNHNKYLTNKNGQTVQDILKEQNIQVPDNWAYFVDENGNTDAILQAISGQIPKNEYYHNPNIKNKDNHTVCYYLFNQGIEIPKQWQDEQYKKPQKYSFNRTKAMEQALNGHIPDKNNYHNSNITNINGNTVASLLAVNGIIPPQQWYHNPLMKHQYNETIAMKLARNSIIPPSKWNHKSDIQNDCGMTVAMILANNGIIPPIQWNHNPEIQDNNGQTVAMYLIKNQIYPPEQWIHDRFIRNNNEQTIQTLLIKNNMKVTNEWKYENILDEYYEKYNTKETLLTPAMYLVQNCIIPSIQLQPNKLLKNEKNQTVAIILSENGIIPPQEWIHDIDMKDNNGNSIKSNLLKYNYTYQNGEFKLNISLINKKSQCCICLEEEQVEFIKTICGHSVCFQCYKELIQKNQNLCCPLCRKQNWVEVLNLQRNQRKKQILIFQQK